MKRQLDQVDHSITVRNYQRKADIVESRQLVLELGTYEPMVQQCLQIIQSTALSQDIDLEVDGKPCTPEFQAFVNANWKSQCYNALQAGFMYGFIPWRIRKTKSGDKCPEVLPPGTFNWSIETNKGTPVNNVDPSTILRYRVDMVDANIQNNKVYIHDFFTPNLDVSRLSNIYAAVPSPLTHVIPDYKNLREAQIRRSHADKWNTTARIVTDYNPPRMPTDNPESSLLQNAEAGLMPDGQTLPMFRFWQERDEQIDHQFTKPTNHTPTVYNMPKHVSQQVLGHLQPCEDIPFLYDKFQNDVTSVFGIPPDMLGNRRSGGRDLTKRAQLSGRIFSANIQRIAVILQSFLNSVYHQIYGGQNINFTLTSIPRLDVESIADLKTLFEIGALSADATAHISDMLLGVESTAVGGNLQKSKSTPEPAKKKAKIDGKKQT